MARPKKIVAETVVSTPKLGTKLDRSRGYGEIFGPDAGKYEQDGRIFDASGDEIGGVAIETTAEKPEEVDADETVADESALAALSRGE